MDFFIGILIFYRMKNGDSQEVKRGDSWQNYGYCLITLHLSGLLPDQIRAMLLSST